MVQFTYDNEPDPSTFLEANYTRMAEMAKYYDQRFETYHIPLNMSTDTVFTNENCTEVSYYAYSDNTGQWTGLAITGFIYKYLTGIKENNSTLKDDALRVIRKLVHGMSMQLAVPNGGLGPDYGAILARGWANPENKDIADFYFQDTNENNDDKYSQHHNGTGVYSNWRWRGYTSNDEYSAFYAALAMLLKYIQEDDVQQLVKLMIDQVASYMLDNNFLGMDWHGGPTGVEQKARFGQMGMWVSLILKMAAISFPEKYERLYYHYVGEELYALWANEGGDQESVSNYYAFAFGYHVAFALLQLEDQPGRLRNMFLDKYQQSLRSYTEYHRNPFYDIIELISIYEPGENTLLERGVEDQLMRYDCVYHFPDRALGCANVSEDPSYQKVEYFEELFAYFNEDTLGNWVGIAFPEVEMDTFYYNKPQTVEYLQGNIFIWEKNPFRPSRVYYNPKYEYASFSFSMIYWMGRATGFFESMGMRNYIEGEGD